MRIVPQIRTEETLHGNFAKHDQQKHEKSWKSSMPQTTRWTGWTEFFANVSHRSYYLTLVLNPLEETINKAGDPVRGTPFRTWN